MKREDMNKAMHTKIIESAIQEFNEKSYEKASMNHICQDLRESFIIISKIKMNSI